MRDRMQPLDALVAAGRSVNLVARPGGVTHLYEGPLTRTGMVPSKARPVCGTRTRRLYDRSSFPVRGDLLVCVRCSARLAPALPAVRAEHPSPVVTSLADDRRRYATLTPVDLYLSIRFAVTEEELDECSVALQLGFTPEQQRATYRSPTGREFSNLPAVIDAQRVRIRNQPGRDLLPIRPKNDPAYWDAVTKWEQSTRRVPKHRRQQIRLRTA